MLNERLKKARRQKEYSQEYVAEYLHTSRQTVARWENGSSVPGADIIKKLAELYDVSVNYLLEIPEKEYANNHLDQAGENISTNTFKEYGSEMLFFLILDIVSIFVSPIGLVVSVVSLLWAKKRKFFKPFYFIAIPCLMLNIWNCFVIFNAFFSLLGGQGTIIPLE